MTEVGLGAETTTTSDGTGSPVAGFPDGTLLDIAWLVGDFFTGTVGVVDGTTVVVDAFGTAALGTTATGC